MDPETPEVTQTEEPKAEETPQSLPDRMLKSASEAWQSAAEESAPADTPETPEAPAADAPEPKADETPKEPESEKITPDQLADKAFWGRLDKAGWERMEREHPVATAIVKAGQAAATRIVNEARKETPKPAEERTDTTKQETLSPEMTAAFAKMQSLDQTEALEGFREMQKLALLETLPQFGFDPNRAKAEQLASESYSQAVGEMPELGKLDPIALDAVVEADPVLMALVETGTKKNVVVAMKRAGETLISKQKAESDNAAAKQREKDEQTKRHQQKLRSNASIPGQVVVEQPSGGSPKGKPSMEEFAAKLYNEAAASNG